MPNKPNVLIGLLSHHGEFCQAMQQSLDGLVRKSHEGGLGLAIKKEYGSVIPRSRNSHCQRAIDLGFTHLLFIDSDMVFDGDALMRLLKHDRDIITGLAVVRSAPFTPVALVKKENGKYEPREGLGEGRFYSDLDACGAAFLLIKTDVLKKIEPPWFAMPPYIDGGCIGEDYYFCQKAKEAGYDICVDTSVIIGHIGEHIFTINEYYEYKAERERREKEDA